MMLFALPANVSAQESRYRWEIGGGVGASGYAGDANDGFMYGKPGVAVELLGRYNYDARWSFRGQATMMTLSGDTERMNNVLPDGENFSFKSTVYDLGARAEFNFFPCGIGETYKHLRRWTPFVSAGVGAVISSVDSRTFTALSIPLGVGVRYKPSPRLNLAAELTFAKTTGDHIDGANLSDVYQIKSSFLKNTDWYSTFAVSVTYEFGERCAVCNRID